MNRPNTVFHRFSLVPVLLLLLLLPLAACGGGPDQGEQVENAETPAPPASDQAPGGGRRGAKGHVTLTGALAFDGDVPVACDAASGQGLEIAFNPNEGEASQVQVQVDAFKGPGDYKAKFVIREGGTARQWNGTAQVEVQSRDMGGKKGGKRTALSGTVNGPYQGEGQGTINASFRRCVLRDQA